MRSDIEFLILFGGFFLLAGFLVGISGSCAQQYRRERKAFRDGMAQGILDATSGQHSYFKRVK